MCRPRFAQRLTRTSGQKTKMCVFCSFFYFRVRCVPIVAVGAPSAPQQTHTKKRKVDYMPQACTRSKHTHTHKESTVYVCACVYVLLCICVPKRHAGVCVCGLRSTLDERIDSAACVGWGGKSAWTYVENGFHRRLSVWPIYFRCRNRCNRHRHTHPYAYTHSAGKHNRANAQYVVKINI